MKYSDDETFPQLSVNYVKLDRVPKFTEGWSPIAKAMRAGDYKSWGIFGNGLRLDFVADVEWTFRWSSSKSSGANSVLWGVIASGFRCDSPRGTRRATEVACPLL
jgi:hypothetical protein